MQTEQTQITRRAGIVAAGTLVSRFLGLLRDQVMAALFSRAATDAFFIAFTIPNVLRQLLAEGATQSAVLPVLAATKETHGDAAAQQFFKALRGLSFALLSAVTLLGVLCSPSLVELFATGFHDQPGQFARTVTLTRWVFPYIFFMGSAALGVAALNTYGRFAATAFAPGLLNLSFIACCLVLPAWFERREQDPALALVVGALLGGLLQVIAQWPSLRRIGFAGWPRFDFKHPGLTEVLKRMAPVLLGIGVYFIDVLIARRLLSQMGTGAQSYFSWALRLCDFPQGIFVMAIQSATLPSLARLVSQRKLTEVADTFSFGLRLALFVGIPASLLLGVLAQPLVVLIFERGAFDAEASRETARALAAQSFGVWMIAAVRQVTAVYYAFGDTRTPVKVAAVDLIVFIVLALLLRGPCGHVGISLALSGSSAVQLALLLLFLRSRLPTLHLGHIGLTAARTLLAAALGAGAASLVVRLLEGQSFGGPGLAKLLPGLFGAATFGGVFLLAAQLLRSEELRGLRQALAARRRR